MALSSGMGEINSTRARSTTADIAPGSDPAKPQISSFVDEEFTNGSPTYASVLPRKTRTVAPAWDVTTVTVASFAATGATRRYIF